MEENINAQMEQGINLADIHMESNFSREKLVRFISNFL